MIAAVHITKGTTWHGHVEEFENVYHFDTPTINTDSGWDELINACVNAEKPIYTTDVQFLRARVHGPTNQTKDDDVMRRVSDLTGVGTGSTSFSIAPELAVVVSIYMGRSPRGYKRFLRKYIHRAALLSSGLTVGMQVGQAALGATHKAPFNTYLNSLKNVTIGAGDNNLCTPSGVHIPVGTNASTNDYVATRQFKRGRKERR